MPAASLDEIQATLVRIEEQTTATNGRVGRLEEDVYGDVEHGTRGLRREFAEIKSIVLDARAVIRVVKWVLPVFATANLGVLIKVLVK